MTRASRSRNAVLLVIFLLASISAVSVADELVFLDDFEGGTPENWLLVLGEWTVADGIYCAVECSS